MTCPARKSADRTRGFTVLELLIYIAIFSVVLVAATSFSYEFALSQAKGVALEEVNRNARFAADRIAMEVRESADLNVGASVFGSNSGTLSLATASPATNPTIFTVSGNTLYVQRGVGVAAALTSSRVDVTEFTLENLSVSGRTKAIRIHLKVRARNGSSWRPLAAETVVETTAKIYKNDGYAN